MGGANRKTVMDKQGVSCNKHHHALTLSYVLSSPQKFNSGAAIEDEDREVDRDVTSHRCQVSNQSQSKCGALSTRDVGHGVKTLRCPIKGDTAACQ